VLKRIMTLSFLPSSADGALLALRICVFLSLFIKHGYEKIFTFSQMAPTFPDPLHMGGTASLVFAMIADGICSLLIVIGLATRLAASYSFVILFVAWSLVQHFIYLGPREDHGQVIWLYLSGMIVIIIGGPGRYSADFLLQKKTAGQD
jgi:putative oxidoreductase